MKARGTCRLHAEWKRTACLAGALLLLGACAARSPRILENPPAEPDGRWAGTDSRRAAAELTRESLSGPWLPQFQAAAARPPVIAVRPIANRSREPIDVDLLTLYIREEYAGSGKVRIAWLRPGREAPPASGDAAARRWASAVGADFVAQGTIRRLVDSAGRQRTIIYRIDLELARVETGERIWAGTRSVRKTAPHPPS